MEIESTRWLDKFLNRFDGYLHYWNGGNTVFFVLVGILFSLNKNIFWDKIHSNTLGWGLLVVTILSSGFYIWRQHQSSKTIERLEKQKNDEIVILKKDKEESELKIQSLENQISKINNNSIALVETHLAYLSEKIKLGCDGRITLYKFINNEFYVLGRFSENPELKKRGRVSYKLEGLIFKAWKEGKFFITKGIPSPTTQKKTFNRKYYQALNKIAPIDKNIIVNMNMKSRSFYLKALKDSGKLQNTSIIVIENLQENAFQESVINSVLNVEEERKLVNFVEKIDWVFPNIDEAKQKGF